MSRFTKLSGAVLCVVLMMMIGSGVSGAHRTAAQTAASTVMATTMGMGSACPGGLSSGLLTGPIMAGTQVVSGPPPTAPTMAPTAGMPTAAPTAAGTAPAVTGTLTNPGGQGSALLANGKGCVLLAVLTGNAVVPDKGDPMANGTVLISATTERDQNLLCYELRVQGISLPATQAGIRAGDVGNAGDMFILFPAPPGADGTANGCVPVSASILTALLAKPASYFVIVRNERYAGGAARGQLGGTVRFSGDMEVPQKGDAHANGVAAISVDTKANTICYNLLVGGIKLPATAAHIHRGTAGQAGPVVVPFQGAPDQNGCLSGCVSADPGVVMDMVKNPAGYYVNVHNADFPDGAARAQLQ